MTSIPEDVESFLRDVAAKEQIEDPSFTLHQSNKKEDGYLGNLFFITMKAKGSGKKLEVVVKKALDEDDVRANFPIDKVYNNECSFYKTLWPAFLHFQHFTLQTVIYDKVPKYYGSTTELKKEKLVLENLKFENFEVMNKNMFFDREHLELILSEYGKFHGISFSYKYNCLGPYQKQMTGVHNYWADLDKMPLLRSSVMKTLNECVEYLTLSSVKYDKTFKLIYADSEETFVESINYTGDHAILLHGDCWSNNIMLKYDVSRKPIDVRFIDFQLIRCASPVYDLSYCIYSGGTKEIFDNLDYYLGIWYHSFSNILRTFRIEESAYSFEMLKKEWKKFARFGFIMGLVLLKGKLVHENEGLSISEMLANPSAEDGKYDAKAVKERSVELIEHVFQRGFLFE